jgi:hypothetical protein
MANTNGHGISSGGGHRVEEVEAKLERVVDLVGEKIEEVR